MSHLLFPLCGKATSLRKFAPEKFVENIIVQNWQGLGRGKGFRVKSRTSIVQGQEYKQVRDKIATRIMNILDLLIRYGAISKAQVSAQLGLSDDGGAKVAFIEEEKKQQTAKLAQSEKTREELEAKLARTEDQRQEIKKVREEYEAKLAQSEDEKREIESKMDSIETDVDSLVQLVGLRPSWYRGIEAKLEALGDELRAIQASRE